MRYTHLEPKAILIMTPLQPAIAILSFNHPQITTRCVKSALQHTSPEHIHLIHNGSSEKHETQLRMEFPEIQHLCQKQNNGFTGGANFGLRRLFKRYEWVFFLTNDCEWLKSSNLPKQPGLYAPKIYRRRIGQIDSIGASVSYWTGKLRHIRTEDESQKLLSRQIFNRFYVPGTAFLIHRDVYFSLNGFDESLHTYWEDVDFSLKAQKSGFHLGIHPDFEVLHHVGKTCHKDPFYSRHLFQRNRRIIQKRHLFSLNRLWFSTCD